METDKDLSSQYFHRWLNKIHSNNNKSFKVLPIIQEFYSKLSTKTGCLNQLDKEEKVKMLKWDQQVDMNLIFECLNSKWPNLIISNKQLINNLFTSTQAQLICLIPSSKLSCTIQVNSSSINNRCLCRYSTKLQASWCKQPTVIFHQRPHPKRLSNSKTILWTTILWIVLPTTEVDQALTCLKIHKENSMEEIFQIFSKCLRNKIHKIWRKGKSK